MRRLRLVDTLLLATVLPLWGARFALEAHWIFSGQDAWLPVYVSASEPRGGYPNVTSISPLWVGRDALAVGDVLVRFGDADLRGVGPMSILASALEEVGPNRRLPAVIQRGMEQRETVLDLTYPNLWDATFAGGREPTLGLIRASSFFVALLMVVVCILVMLRAPQSRVGRPLFLGVILLQLAYGYMGPGPRALTYALLGLRALGTFSIVFGLRALSLIPENLVPKDAPAPRWPWLLMPPILLIFWSALFGFPLASETTWRVAYPVMNGSVMLVALGVLTRNFIRADAQGRRQIKWLMYGVYIFQVPMGVLSLLWLLRVDSPWLSDLVDVLPAVWMLTPVCIFIAIARYNLFDIDRLISATTSYTVLGIAALALILALVPRVSAAASPAIGIDPQSGQMFLSLALAAVVVPAHRILRPQIDRLFFAERYAFERGVENLLGRLSAAAGPEELLRDTGDGLDAVLRPESCVIYARAGETYSAVVARGRAVPSAFPADGPLVATLQAHPSALAAERWSHGRRKTQLSPFERAALETLAVAVVLPIRRADALVALVCLGDKRSGDVYTSTDLVLLNAVADKVSGELLRFDYAEIARQAQAMQETLRRYVPSAVATRLIGGQALESAECDVSVLFVDIRGYTAYAEGRRAEETFSTVSRYTEAVSTIVTRHGGAVVEFNGDGMMAVFGAPEALAQKERAAVEAGREIIEAMDALPPNRPGDPQLSVGVGIATGGAFVGNIQSADRLIWTAVGNPPNLAARLQSLTRELGAAMVIDGVTRRGAGYVAADFTRREQIPIRGRTDTQDVYVLPLGR